MKTHTKQNHTTPMFVGACVLLLVCVPTMVPVALATGATHGSRQCQHTYLQDSTKKTNDAQKLRTTYTPSRTE